MGETRGVPRASAFVGRTDELQELVGIATALTSSGAAPGLVTLVGEAGIGKSRLLDEFVATVSEPVSVVRGRADELDTTAFGMWLPVLTRFRLPRPGSDPSVPAGEQRWEVVDLLATALDEAAPVLVVLDDLHWADDESLWVCEHLLDRVGHLPVAVVAATRPAAESRSARWHALYRRTRAVAVDGLSADDIARLASSLGVAVPDADALRSRTGGNPLFVREQLSADGSGLSTTIESLLNATIDRLSPLAAESVSLLAIAGADTPFEVLAEALHAELSQVEAAITAAHQADLLVDRAGARSFRHDLLAEVATSRLVGRRADAHRALAEAWERRQGLDAVLRATRHHVLAVPTTPASDAVARALRTAAQLDGSGRRTDAAGLLLLTRRELAEAPDLDAADRARVALAEGEIRWALDDYDGASAACQAALTETATLDPLLIAAIEVAALQHHNPFEGDPLRIERLAQLDAQLTALPDVDPVLHLRLRGRRAFLLMTMPNGVDEAAALGDSVVAAARAVGDPDVLVPALRDRFFALRNPDDHRARAQAAQEIIDLARSTHRPDLALQGHEWTYASRIGSGDLAGAVGALDELESLAAIMPSPLWRYSAAVRRAGAMAYLGDYEGSLHLAEASARLARGIVSPSEANGLELGLRVSAGALYGRDDHGGEALVRTMRESLASMPVLFLQAMQALAEVCVGEADQARRRVARWQGRFATALDGHEGLPALSALAQVVIQLQWVDAAPELQPLLLPFAGMFPVGNSASPDLSVDHRLAELALLLDDVPTAVNHARDAVALARRLRSPAVEARALALLAGATRRAGDTAAAASARDAADTLAEPLGLHLPDDPDSPTRPAPRTSAPPAPPDERDRTVTVQLDAGRWLLASPMGRGHVPDSVGMRQLVRLVTRPGLSVASTDLVAASTSGPIAVASDLGPALDARAKREYRQRLSELQSEIDEAEANNDLDRAAKHQMELEALITELRAAVGIGGRDRPQRSGNERARVNVARTVRRAIAAVSATLPDLGAHLQVSIQTGHHCCYAPEPAAALRWEQLGAPIA